MLYHILITYMFWLLERIIRIPSEENGKGTDYEILFNINNQQDRIICRRLNEMNKMMAPLSKYIHLNSTTWMESQN